jgi:hypothetical protein
MIKRKSPRIRKEETWFYSTWRPAMAWVYMAIVVSDFIIFPILWSILQAIKSGVVTNQWNPLTLLNGGLFHIAMCSVLGVTAWSRGKENLSMINNQSQSSQDDTKQ